MCFYKTPRTKSDYPPPYCSAPPRPAPVVPVHPSNLLPPSLSPGSRDAVVEQASIAGGAGVALLVCLLLSGLLYVWSKRRRKSAS